MKAFRKGLLIMAPFVFFTVLSVGCDAQVIKPPSSEAEFYRTIKLYQDTMIETMFRLDSLYRVEIAMGERNQIQLRSENKRLRKKNMVLVLGVAACIVAISFIQ